MKPKPLDLEFNEKSLRNGIKNDIRHTDILVSESELVDYLISLIKKERKEIKQQIKSALQGLLNDIEKLNKNSRDCKIISISYKDLENIAFENGYQLAMKKCIKLIKKWFPDVMRDE